MNPLAVGKAHMIKKLKDNRDAERQIVMCQIQSVRDLTSADKSKDAKLNLLEKAIYIVDKHKMSLGKVKNMSSLEKNRIALNLISTLRQRDEYYQ